MTCTIFAWDDQQIAPEKIHLTREEINTPSPSPNIVYKSGTLFRLQPSPFLDMQRKFSPSIGFKSFLKQLNCQAGLPLLQMFHIYLAYSVHHWLSLLSNSLLQDKYHHSKPERQLYITRSTQFLIGSTNSAPYETITNHISHYSISQQSMTI